MRARDSQQYLRRAIRLPSILLPVLESVDADPEERRKLCLTQFESSPEGRDVQRIRVDKVGQALHARWFQTPRLDSLHLVDALNEFVKQVFSHSHPR